MASLTHARPFRRGGAIALGLMMGLGASTTSLAVDPNSVRAIEAATGVHLEWTDLTTTTYCVQRNGNKVPPRAIIAQTPALSYDDLNPPAVAVLYYDVSEPATGICQSAMCSTAQVLGCGGSVMSDTALDPSATSSLDSYPGCGVFDATGAELAYLVAPAQAVNLTATLTTAFPELDILVIEDRGNGCDPIACIAGGDTMVTFPAAAGTMYWIVVDGRNGTSGPFALQLTCPTSSCSPAGERLDCGAALRGRRNDEPGSTMTVTDWSPCALTDADGPEYLFELTAPRDVQASLDLRSLNPNLQLVVLSAPLGTCESGNCVESGAPQVSFAASGGARYFIGVDGRNQAADIYSLDLVCSTPVCQPTRSIDCNNRQDTFSTMQQDSLHHDYSPCSSGLTGPEVVYTFAPSQDQTVTFQLSGLLANLDLLVLADTGSGCDTTACIAEGDSAVSFRAVPGTTYYIIVDGRNGAISDYTLTLSCGNPQPCMTNGSILCPPAAGRLGSTTDPGSTDLYDTYPCAPGRDLSGREMAFEFFAPDDGMVSVAILNPAPPDLDILVLADDGSGCGPSACLAWGDTATSFQAVRGQKYAIVVDGVSAAAGAYNVRFNQCPPSSGLCSVAATLACGAMNARFGDTLTLAGRTQTSNAYTCAPGRDESGFEYTYLFVPPVAGQGTRVTASLLNPSTDLDVFVLEDTGAGCDPSSCVDWGDSAVSADLLANQVYFITVDSAPAEEGPYQILLDCSTIPGMCNGMSAIGCGATLTGENNMQPGHTDVIDTYEPPCQFIGSLDESGPEVAYRFTAPLTGGMVTVSLSNNPQILHLYIIEELAGGCHPDQCRFFDTSPPLTFAPTPGATYYLVVDGFRGAVSNYDISVSCN